MPDPDQKPVEMTDEEKDALRRAKQRLANKQARERLRGQRGVTTYAQRQALRRAKREAAEKKQEEIAKARQARVERRRRAVDMWLGGATQSKIAVELGVGLSTVGLWLKGVSRPEPEPPPDVMQEALAMEASTAVADERLAARDEEEQALMDIADSQDNPADQYQAYVAAMGIRLLRDNIKLVRGPRTIRELDALDQMIRRSLGLNSKGGGTGGKLNIDISILNNTKASSGAIAARVTVDAEEA